MWCLKGREGVCVYILPNEKKSFGKTLSDIKLEGDATISRFHAVISVEPTEESEIQYKCVINDVSKYGTFVTRDKKKIKLPSDDKFILKADDIVQFGLKESIFVVSCHTFIIAKSSLDEEDTNKLKDIVHNLKATLSESWENSCTHLTVAKSTLFTTKLAYALASAKPIVTNAYWEAVNIAVKESKELPEIENYLPKVKEEWLIVCSRMFLPNEKRKTLFKGLSFVHFCAKQYFAYAPLIIAAGGKSCVYPTKRPLTPRDLTAKNAIVIQQPTNDSSQLTQVIAADYPIIYHKLQTVKRRMVSDTEIPLAILYCNTETYCNPKYDFATFFKKLETQKFLSSDMIIENTQDIVNTDMRSIKRKIIPETCELEDNKNVTKKVRCFDENERNISDVNKSNIATMQNTDNRESKCKIIPETCDSQINKTVLKSSSYKSEWKCMSDTNESNITINNMQNIDKEIKRKVFDKTYDFQNNENISVQPFSEESEQRYVSNISKSNILAKTQNKKDIYVSNEQKNIDSDKTDIANNILPNNANKQFQIIPESCYSIEKNLGDIFSDRSNNKEIQIFETCEFNKELVGNNFPREKEQQSIKLQKKEIFKENNAKNKEKNMLQENQYNFQQQENLIINKENNTIFETNNLDKQKGSIVEKGNLNNNSKFIIARSENSKNVEILHTISIKKINDSDIEIKQEKESIVFGKDYSRVELQDLLKEQKLSLICNSEKNKKSMKEDKIQIKDNKGKPQTGGNKRYLNQGFTDKILRRDMPCGKKFIKMSVMKPKRILKVDDFVL